MDIGFDDGLCKNKYLVLFGCLIIVHFLCATFINSMSDITKPKRDSKDYTTVTVLKKHHQEIVSYLEANVGEYDIPHIGKFYDAAAMEKLSRLKSQSPFSKMDSKLLLSNGWVKQGNIYTKDANNGMFDKIHYSGTSWFHNGELLTEQNYLEKIK